jgi:CheY-like chemotaxis protein
MRAAAKILIVDHEANARNALSELLREEGYDVDSVRDCVDAQARMAQFRPDLVLTNFELPGCEERGRGAANAGEDSRPPAVLRMVLQAPSPNAGHRFVQKPIRLRELLVMVEQILADRFRPR